MKKLSNSELLKPSGVKCKCGNDIPVGRREYSNNPDVCIVCDDEQRKGAVQVINGKVGNSIQIVDMETSTRINRLQDRKGGIVGAGMKGTAKTTTL